MGLDAGEEHDQIPLKRCEDIAQPKGEARALSSAPEWRVLETEVFIPFRILVSASLLLTSKRWRLQSGCNHLAAYVDQWKG